MARYAIESLRHLPADDRRCDHHQFHHHPCHAGRSDRRNARPDGDARLFSSRRRADRAGLHRGLRPRSSSLCPISSLPANLMMGDLGYSLAYFPQKVSSVVLRAVPWSAGLLLFSVLLAFVIGNLLGALAVWRRAPWLLQGAHLFLHDAVGDAVLPARADPALPLRVSLADLPDRRDVHGRQFARVWTGDAVRFPSPRDAAGALHLPRADRVSGRSACAG